MSVVTCTVNCFKVTFVPGAALQSRAPEGLHMLTYNLLEGSGVVINHSKFEIEVNT